MKKKTMKANILIASICLGLLVVAHGQEVSMEKNYARSFFSKEGDKIEVFNKYGEIIVQPWLSDSVRFEVVLRANGKNQESVNKVVRRIDVELRKIGNLITARTKVDRKSSGFLNDLLNDFGEYSKSVLGNNKFTVDYQIWIPADLDVSIENRFGNLYLGNLEGEVAIDLAHGDIRGNRFGKSVRLKHSYGKATFEHIEKGNLNLRGSELKVQSSGQLDFQSSSSEIYLEAIRNLRFDSRNDKFFIEEVENMEGEGSFTDLDVQAMGKNGRLDFSYGDIYLRSIATDFKLLDINGNSTDINIILDQYSYLRARIEGPEDRMILPNSMLSLKREMKDEKTISLEGFVGNTNAVIGDLSLKTKGGKVIVAIEEIPIFSKQE